jgi:histidinol-phosphate aminotransferase
MSRHLLPEIAALPATVPFTGPETLERRAGRAFAARLGANESGFGPSPHAVAAMRAAARGAWMYGDPEMWALRTALARHHGVTPAHVQPGEGIDGLLCTLVRLCVGPGTPVVTSLGAYPTFAFHVAACGGVLTRVPYRDDREDPQALIDAARATGARLLYLANPDNPMGSHHAAGVIEAMVANLPEGTLLVLDEAYADTAPPGTVPDIAADDPRVIRLRTFSKAHGLAGLRVGYALAEPGLIAAFDRIRNHFGVGRVAQAGALAALEDQAHLAKVVARIGRSRERLGRIARANGLSPLPSATNFVTMDAAGRDARRLVAALADAGVFVRMPAVAPLDRCIRVGCGPRAAMDAFAAALPRALARL